MSNDLTDMEDASLWSPTIEKIYIDIMVEEVNKGNMSSGQFGSKIWFRIHEELKTKSKKNFSLKQVKQKFNRLRSKHREFTELLNQTGFGWDPETNTVNAMEGTWQTYLKAHPKASQFRKKGCEHYHLLGLIFCKSTATGKLHCAPGLSLLNSDDERELEEEYSNSSYHAKFDKGVDTDSTSHSNAARILDEMGNHVAKRTASTSTERRAKKQLRSEQMTDALKAWTEAMKVRTNINLSKFEQERKNKSPEGGCKKDDFSLTNCVQSLEKMEGVDDAMYMKAVAIFKEDPDWREIFINMSSPRKKGLVG